MASANTFESFDVLIVGAGISGINTAHAVQSRGPPGLTYAVLERRGRIGGTWDLFQYPGIRSDSDVFTFGFSWNPWQGNRPIATGDKICAYLNESAAKSGIDKNIRFYENVLSADWSSESSTWNVKVKKGGDEGVEIEYRAKFLVVGTGYYDHDEPLKTTIPGLQSFKGSVVHPQFWPSDLNYINKDVVVIGSGATAVTLVPSMAQDARHVTMLQRSPSYIVSLSASKWMKFIMWTLRTVLPRMIAGHMMRNYFAFYASYLYHLCQWFPKVARKALQEGSKKQLPPGYDINPDFVPRYGPWDQRLCMCPDGDFYSAIRSTKASVVTDVIREVTEDSIHLQSGKVLRPDIIVTATGLKVMFAGKMRFSIDGEPYDPTSKFALKGCMLQDAPNLSYVFGYASSSWTLGAESTGLFLTRLWNLMSSQKIKVVIPRAKDADKMSVFGQMDLSSTYLQVGVRSLPKAGEGLWAPRKNYLKGMYQAAWPSPLQGLELRK